MVSDHEGLRPFALLLSKTSGLPFSFRLDCLHSKELAPFDLVISIVAQRHSLTLSSSSRPRNLVTLEARSFNFAFIVAHSRACFIVF